jgi:Protein of unknown function (DUF2835)
MQKMSFSMHLSSEKYLQFYQGVAKDVIVKTDDGRTLKFPASRLQSFVTQDGITGKFEILFDDDNKIVSLNRIA